MSKFIYWVGVALATPGLIILAIGYVLMLPGLALVDIGLEEEE